MSARTHTQINPFRCYAYILVFESFDWMCVSECVCTPSKCLSVHLIHQYTSSQHSSSAIFHTRCEMAEKMQFVWLICMDLQIASCPNSAHNIVSFIIYILLMDLRWLFHRRYTQYSNTSKYIMYIIRHSPLPFVLCVCAHL